MKIRYIDPTRLFWVYTIILISNTDNLHVYSEPTVIRVRSLEIFSKFWEASYSKSISFELSLEKSTLIPPRCRFIVSSLPKAVDLLF